MSAIAFRRDKQIEKLIKWVKQNEEYENICYDILLTCHGFEIFRNVQNLEEILSIHFYRWIWLSMSK